MKKYLVLKENGELTVIDERNYPSTYDMLSLNVKGSIEVVDWIPQFHQKGIDLWINEEGRLVNLLPTIAIKINDIYKEVLCRNVVFARFDDEGGTLPLKDEDIEYITRVLRKCFACIEFYNSFTGTRLENIVTVINM